jgi:hypothetical protein
LWVFGVWNIFAKLLSPVVTGWYPTWCWSIQWVQSTKVSKGEPFAVGKGLKTQVAKNKKISSSFLAYLNGIGITERQR